MEQRCEWTERELKASIQYMLEKLKTEQLERVLMYCQRIQ